jgi:putative colanic acid biosynthesis acetyltransferase WcaF
MRKVNVDTHGGASFAVGNRAMRLLWGLVYWLAFRPSPRPFHAWRSFLLRLFGAKIGNGVHIYPGVSVWAPWNLEVHDQAGVGNGVTLYNQGSITIGRRAVISQGAHLCAGTHDYAKKGFPLITKPIVVGADVWIAAEAFIHPGVSLGEGCVIGARAVVTKDMPPWMVCAGHPCLPIKERSRPATTL